VGLSHSIFRGFQVFLNPEVYLIYSVVLISGVQQTNSVICVCVCNKYSFSHSFPLGVLRKYWVWFPVLYHRSCCLPIIYIYTLTHFLYIYIHTHILYIYTHTHYIYIYIYIHTHIIYICILIIVCVFRASPVTLVRKNPPGSAGDPRDPGLTPGLGRSLE